MSESQEWSKSQVWAPAHLYGISGGSPNGWAVITRDANDNAWRVYLGGPMDEDVARTTAHALNESAEAKA